MSVRRFETVERIATPLDEVWEFFSNPRNLPVITPPSLGLRLTCEPPPEMHPGLILTYTVRPIANIPINWVTEITHVVEGKLFVDEQRFGPYRFWHHQHHFRPIEGGTEMRDIVHYALPLGPLGHLAAGRTVRTKLEAIFAFRRQALQGRFDVMEPPRISHTEPGTSSGLAPA